MKILYEDNHLIAIWKNSGVLAQGDRSNASSAMDDVKKYLKEKYKKPGMFFSDFCTGWIDRLQESFFSQKQAKERAVFPNNSANAK